MHSVPSISLSRRRRARRSGFYTDLIDVPDESSQQILPLFWVHADALFLTFSHGSIAITLYAKEMSSGSDDSGK